jgi:diguanylate cyclase (GGDEF)-like protein
MGKHRPRLLLRFGLISALAIAALGVVLVAELNSTIRGQAVDEGRTLARLATDLRVVGNLRPSDLEAPNPINSARLHGLLDADLEEAGVVRINIWNLDGHIVFSSAEDGTPEQEPVTADLREALHGREIAGIEEAEEAEDSSNGDLVEVYVPLRFTKRGPVEGAFEVYLPYKKVAASGRKKVKRTVFILIDGLVLLWAALFRLVAGASRRLRNQAEENRRLAREDALTGLANRTSFTELAAEALAKRPTHAAVLLLDLDRFKDLNDSLGHHAGDLLLREIGPRLSSALPEGSVVARLGGDEFATLLAPIEDPHEAERAARRVRDVLQTPVEIEGIAVSAEGSVGIAHYPADGQDVATLLQRADVAMYEAKERRVGVATYQPDADRSSHERLLMLAQLREAIERDELVLHYQPKVALGTGAMVGAEALVRWEHPERGLIGPVQFVPLAEHTGLIGPLTAWVLRQALRDTRAWWDRGHRISVAVNLSVANLVDPDLPSMVAALLAETRLPPAALEFEITESVLMTEPERALRTLTLLRGMGTKLAVDDYGTGHSSLAYLHRLPLNTLKIDRSFISSMAGEGGVIVRSTVELAHSLGLDVVAEGIEDHRTAVALRVLGCDLGQGFHYARPVPIDQLLRRLEPEPDPGFTVTVAEKSATETGADEAPAPVETA